MYNGLRKVVGQVALYPSPTELLILVPDNCGKGLAGDIQFTQSSPWSYPLTTSSVAGPADGGRKNPCLI